MLLYEDSYNGKDFSDFGYFDGDELLKKSFKSCKMRGMDLEDKIFRKCIFDECDFSMSHFTGSKFYSCVFLNCTFNNSSLIAATFDGSRFTGSSFAGTDMGTAHFECCDFSYALLQGLRYKRKDVISMNFTGARLCECVFLESCLHGCSFKNASFVDVSFEKTDIREADFTGSNLTACKLTGARISLLQSVMIAESLGAVCADDLLL